MSGSGIGGIFTVLAVSVILIVYLAIVFWYITIPATIIIIVIIWLSSRDNKKNSTDHSERTYYKQPTADSNNQYKDSLIRDRLGRFDLSEEEAELVFGKRWRTKLGSEHYKLFDNIVKMQMNLLDPSKVFRKKVFHIIDKVIRMIDSVYNEDPECMKSFEKFCEDYSPGLLDYFKREWEFFKKYKKSSFEYSENTLDKSEAYEILGLGITATVDEVKKKFRELALKWHPDRNMKNKTQAEKMFVKINNAYETIMAAA